MITVVDLAFELWFASCDYPLHNKAAWRAALFNRCVDNGRLSDGMERAFKTAALVIGLAERGAFVKSPVGFVATDGVVH